MKSKNITITTKIFLLRILLLITIIIAGFISSFLSFYFITTSQYELYEQEFENIIRDNYLSIKNSLIVQLKLNIEVSVMFGMVCHQPSSWPNCALPAEIYEELTEQLSAVSQISQFGMLPIVTEQTRLKFENFSLHTFQMDPAYPPQTGIHGIYTFDSNHKLLYSNVSYDFSPHNILVPLFQVSNLQLEPLNILYNVHSHPIYASTIDSILECTKSITPNMTWNPSERKQNMKMLRTKCSALTDFILDENGFHTSSIGTPIFPFTDPNIVAFSSAQFTWESMVSSTIKTESSFKCVIESTSSSTKLVFDVEKGIIKQGKFSDPPQTLTKKFRKPMKRSFQLTDDDLFIDSPIYTITYYSTYKSPTSVPATIASVGCICVTIVISLVFELFTILINKEFQETNSLLNSKRIFVRFISHEIRTPLNTIVLGLRLLQEHINSLKSKNEVNKIIQESLELIEELSENSAIAVTTLNDLINYDKIESKTFNIEKTVVDIWSVVEKTINPLRLQAQEKDVKMVLNLQLTNPDIFAPTKINLKNLRVLGDSIKLSQVIRNLVSNALKFTPPKGDVKIDVQYEENYPQATKPTHVRKSWQLSHPKHQIFSEVNDQIVGNIIITVTDTGPGLTLEQQRKLFCEGVQFNANKLQQGQGSGLGLWISREIVNLHSGKISVKSKGLGLGASFVVTFPVRLQTEEKGDSPQSIHDEIENSPFTKLKAPSTTQTVLPTHSNDRYVLVVDDAASNRKMVIRMLKSRGYICHEAENGLECVEKIESGLCQYDMILLDYEMPVMDGPSAAKALRDKKYDILIIGVTGNVLPEDQAHFIKQGANLVLSKPVNIDNLISNVQLLQTRMI